jgi:hypothetical protein
MMPQTVRDLSTAIANDAAVVAAKDAEGEASKRLQTLLAEQATARETLNALSITAATRPQRQKLRAIDIEISYEIEEAHETLASRHLDVVRAQHAVAAKGALALSEQARVSGALLLEKISDVLDCFQELRSDHEAGQALRSVVVQADKELSEETPAPPTVKFSSGLGEGIWEALLRLAEVSQEQRSGFPRQKSLQGAAVGTVVTMSGA